jgi:hypothetical protein
MEVGLAQARAKLIASVESTAMADAQKVPQSLWSGCWQEEDKAKALKTLVEHVEVYTATQGPNLHVRGTALYLCGGRQWLQHLLKEDGMTDAVIKLINDTPKGDRYTQCDRKAILEGEPTGLASRIVKFGEMMSKRLKGNSRTRYENLFCAYLIQRIAKPVSTQDADVLDKVNKQEKELQDLKIANQITALLQDLPKQCIRSKMYIKGQLQKIALPELVGLSENPSEFLEMVQGWHLDVDEDAGLEYYTDADLHKLMMVELSPYKKSRSTSAGSSARPSSVMSMDSEPDEQDVPMPQF